MLTHPAPCHSPEKDQQAVTALEYRAARNMLGVNVETLAKKIGLSRAMSYRYESGQFDIPEMVAKMIELLLERGSTPKHW